MQHCINGIGSINCIGSGVSMGKKKKTTLMNTKENRSKFTCHVSNNN